jgi:uncharacterized protein
VLGILVMNIRNLGLPLNEFDNPRYPSGTLSPANLWVWMVSNVVFEDKMIAIFSMLFGAGIVVMSGRALQSGAGAAMIHYRRMLWLFLIGLLHAYGLWYGDILNTYAVCGAALYPLRRARPALLVALGVVLLAVTVGIRVGPPLYHMVQPAAPGATAPLEPKAETRSARIWRESVRDEEAAYRGGYAGEFRWRARLNTLWHFDGGINFNFWRCGGFILIGMGLMKMQVLSGSRPAIFYAAVSLGAYAAGLTLYAVGFGPQLARVVGHAPELAPEARRIVGLAAWPARFIGSAAIALGHIGLVLLVCKAAPARRLLSPLGAVGRMALTNYLMQTAICVVIFDGWAMGYWGRWDLSELALLVGAIWALQLIVSPLWLWRFGFGPMEWLWRSLTYLNPQPMLVRSAP